METAAVILCAGTGSRMGLRGHINKCAAPIKETSPVRHMASAFLSAGVENLIIVLGHAQDSVRLALAETCKKTKVSFVVNPQYAFLGCNYSVACGMLSDEAMQAKRVLIAEGDSLLHPESLRQIAGAKAESASLIRSLRFVDFSRSVIAIGKGDKIVRFDYDQEHSGKPPEISDDEFVIGESMQVWSFSGLALQKIRAILEEYKNKADSSGVPMKESGVYSINMLGTQIVPVTSDYPEQWINLNTKGDLRRAGEQKWLQK